MDLARATGVHRNTVLLYEQWGFLPAIPRAANGYRQYTASHLEQMRLARIALPGPYPGGGQPVQALVKAAARGDYAEARRQTQRYAANVRREARQALAALRELEAWARQPPAGAAGCVHRRVAAGRVGCSLDALRTWERNGLARIGKDRRGYCQYDGATISRLKIIRALRTAGYSIAAILRMLGEYDTGNRQRLRSVINTPAPDADILYVTDYWLTTLAEHRRRARRIRQQLERLASPGR